MIICKKNFDEIVEYVKDRTPDFDAKTATIFVLNTMLDQTDYGLCIEHVNRYDITPDKKWFCFVRRFNKYTVAELGIDALEIEFARIVSILEVPTHIYTQNKTTPQTLIVYITEKVCYRGKR